MPAWGKPCDRHGYGDRFHKNAQENLWNLKHISKQYLEKKQSPTSKYSTEEVLIFLEKFVDVYRDYENSKDDTVDYTDMLLLFVKHFKPV